MTQREIHLGSRSAPGLQKRLRDVGILQLECDGTGKLISRPSPGADWMMDLFCQAPIFIIALRQAAAQWAEQPAPEPLEIFPGCWVGPLPRIRFSSSVSAWSLR